MNILSILAALWRELLIVTLICFILYQNTSNVRFLLFIDTLPHLRQEIVDINTKYEKCQKVNEELSDVINERNLEVLQWKTVSDKLEKENLAALEILSKIKGTTKSKVKDVMQGKTPVNCKEVTDYLREGVNELTW